MKIIDPINSAGMRGAMKESMANRTSMLRVDDEPEAICRNCDSWQEDLNGRHHCLNDRSEKQRLLTEAMDHCAKFFPDPRRWPDADHG